MSFVVDGLFSGKPPSDIDFAWLRPPVLKKLDWIAVTARGMESFDFGRLAPPCAQDDSIFFADTFFAHTLRTHGPG